MTNVNPQDFCQLEIVVSDLNRSLLFYENVFGWRKVPTEIQDYLVLEVPENCPFGVALILGKKDGLRSRTTLYFKTKDAKKIGEKAMAYGGRFSFGPKKLPGYGTIYQVEDPDGQRFGLFEAL